jgi:hypothetical protein
MNCWQLAIQEKKAILININQNRNYMWMKNQSQTKFCFNEPLFGNVRSVNVFKAALYNSSKVHTVEPSDRIDTIVRNSVLIEGLGCMKLRQVSKG